MNVDDVILIAISPQVHPKCGRYVSWILREPSEVNNLHTVDLGSHTWFYSEFGLAICGGSKYVDGLARFN
jgi:hypothetical protein